MKRRELTEEEKRAIAMKYEIAEELGLLDKVEKYGWKCLTAKESGRIGGIMSKKRRREERNTNNEEQSLKKNSFGRKA